MQAAQRVKLEWFCKTGLAAITSDTSLQVTKTVEMDDNEFPHRVPSSNLVLRARQSPRPKRRTAPKQQRTECAADLLTKRRNGTKPGQIFKFSTIRSMTFVNLMWDLAPKQLSAKTTCATIWQSSWPQSLSISSCQPDP